MAGNRYGGHDRREGWRERGSSIFPDDDDRGRRSSGDHGQGEREDERGFLERAGDELRSWFGDEEAERRRETDMRRDDALYAFGDYGGPQADRTPYGGFGRSERRGWTDHGRGGMFGRSQWDDNYRRWRARQIEQLDREYEEYCRERQHQFDQDFDSWRSSRLTQGGTTGYGNAGAGPGRAGATTSVGGTASAARASKGSSGDAAAAGNATAAPSGGRGGRARS